MRIVLASGRIQPVACFPFVTERKHHLVKCFCELSSLVDRKFIAQQRGIIPSGKKKLHTISYSLMSNSEPAHCVSRSPPPEEACAPLSNPLPTPGECNLPSVGFEDRLMQQSHSVGDA